MSPQAGGRRWLVASVVFVFAFVLSGAQTASATVVFPQVQEVQADLTTGVLLIRGQDFTRTSKDQVQVWLSGEALTVDSFTATEIAARLPAGTEPGTYQLVVVRLGGLIPLPDAMDVTFGAVGAQGPPGERGPKGDTGDPGPPGLPGAPFLCTDGDFLGCFTGPSTSRGRGRCRDGERRCTSGAFGGCVGEVLPVAEVCNSLDDDCDGTIDGAGVCGPPPCPHEPERCNGIDDDCDGLVDEALGVVSCGTGACAATVPACTAGTPTVCTPLPPQEEVCNFQDDDCDGQIDHPGCALFPSNIKDACDASAAGDLALDTGITQWNTSTGCDEVIVQAPPGAPICVRRFNTVQIAAGATLRVSGPNAIALVALEEMAIHGTIEARSGPCVAGAGCGQVDFGGGGAGFGTAGAGVGGFGGGGMAYGSPRLIPLLGGSGTPNGGGGAVQLVSCGQLTLGATGVVQAGGAGGSAGNSLQTGSDDGTGGASGGGILIEGETVSIAGIVAANGGGGGGGSAGEGMGGPGQPGQPGLTPAQGGFGDISANSGGAGGAAGVLPEDGVAGQAGDGGGGGAVGRIRIRTRTGSPNLTGATISPAPVTE